MTTDNYYPASMIEDVYHAFRKKVRTLIYYSPSFAVLPDFEMLMRGDVLVFKVQGYVAHAHLNGDMDVRRAEKVHLIVRYSLADQKYLDASVIKENQYVIDSTREFSFAQRSDDIVLEGMEMFKSWALKYNPPADRTFEGMTRYYRENWVAVDLENTLINPGPYPWDDERRYTEATVNWDFLNKFLKKYSAGNYIVMFSACPLEFYNEIVSMLDKNDITFDKLSLNKFHFQTLVDDKALRPEEI